MCEPGSWNSHVLVLAVQGQAAKCLGLGLKVSIKGYSGRVQQQSLVMSYSGITQPPVRGSLRARVHEEWL